MGYDLAITSDKVCSHIAIVSERAQHINKLKDMNQATHNSTYNPLVRKMWCPKLHVYIAGKTGIPESYTALSVVLHPMTVNSPLS